MSDPQSVTITTRDRLLMAWLKSMELVRDFQAYAKDTRDDPDAARLFAEYAEREGLHASKLLEKLRGLE